MSAAMIPRKQARFKTRRPQAISKSNQAFVSKPNAIASS